MKRSNCWLPVGLLAIATIGSGRMWLPTGDVAAAQSQSGMPVFMATRHLSGQNVAPVYEGWIPNPDGTFSLYFGYMNRNYQEEPDIPVGADNSIEPGGPDRGQPTHFLPRRHKNVFKVEVPRDFGGQKLVWTLSIRGKTETIVGTLRPAYEIVVSRNRLDGNTPPVVETGPDQTITLPATATLTVAVTDDGLPKPRTRPSEPAKPPSVTVEWSKYRGPGNVTFAPDKQTVLDGKATTTATFNAPGHYVIQAVADDGSRAQFYHCCWTNAQLGVTVNPARGAPSGQ